MECSEKVIAFRHFAEKKKKKSGKTDAAIQKHNPKLVK